MKLFVEMLAYLNINCGNWYVYRNKTPSIAFYYVDNEFYLSLSKYTHCFVLLHNILNDPGVLASYNVYMSEFMTSKPH